MKHMCLVVLVLSLLCTPLLAQAEWRRIDDSNHLAVYVEDGLVLIDPASLKTDMIVCLQPLSSEAMGFLSEGYLFLETPLTADFSANEITMHEVTAFKKDGGVVKEKGGATREITAFMEILREFVMDYALEQRDLVLYSRIAATRPAQQ